MTENPFDPEGADAGPGEDSQERGSAAVVLIALFLTVAFIVGLLIFLSRCSAKFN